MTAAIIALSAFGLAAVVGLVLLAVKLSGALDNERATLTQMGLAQDAQLAAEKLRDEAVAALAQRTAERDAAVVQLVATQQTAVVAAKENADHVGTTIANAAPADAGALLDAELLAPILPAVAGAPRVAAADGAGHTGAAAVPPAGAAGSVAGSPPRGG